MNVTFLSYLDAGERLGDGLEDGWLGPVRQVHDHEVDAAVPVGDDEFDGRLDALAELQVGVQPDVDRAGDLVDRAAEVGAVAGEDFLEPQPFLGTADDHVPLLGPAGGGPQGALGPAAA